MPLYRRVPKLKHFSIVNPHNYTVINVGKLNSLSPQTEVTLESLIEQGVITSNDGPLKVLGDGNLEKPLTIQAAAFTKSAKEKIEAAGGSWKELS